MSGRVAFAELPEYSGCKEFAKGGTGHINRLVMRLKDLVMQESLPIDK
jgi:hypothetical protein